MNKETFTIRLARGGVRSAAEALFPKNDFGAPDFETTDVANRFIEYLFILPATQRSLLILLFTTLQIFFPLMVPALLPFSMISAEKREKALRRWLNSKVFAIRMLTDAIRASLSMIYMSHISVIEYTGEFKGLANIDDHLAFPIRWPKSLVRPPESSKQKIHPPQKTARKKSNVPIAKQKKPKPVFVKTKRTKKTKRKKS